MFPRYIQVRQYLQNEFPKHVNAMWNPLQNSVTFLGYFSSSLEMYAYLLRNICVIPDLLECRHIL